MLQLSALGTRSCRSDRSPPRAELGAKQSRCREGSTSPRRTGGCTAKSMRVRHSSWVLEMDGHASRRLHQVAVTLGLELKGEVPATGRDDAAGGQNMHLVRHDVVQEALIMSDKQSRAGSPAPCVDAVADDLERVDVEAGICLVEDGQAGIEQPHLKDFVT